MPNGKGWLACWDCEYYKHVSKNNASLCEKYNQKLPDDEALKYLHTFCPEFHPIKSSEKILNGMIEKKGDAAYYHVYKPGSPYVNSGCNKIIPLVNNKLYGYVYSQPDEIHVVMDIK